MARSEVMKRKSCLKILLVESHLVRRCVKMTCPRTGKNSICSRKDAHDIGLVNIELVKYSGDEFFYKWAALEVGGRAIKGGKMDSSLIQERSNAPFYILMVRLKLGNSKNYPKYC